MVQLTREEHDILSYVSKFGCLDIEQLKVLMQPLESKYVITLPDQEACPVRDFFQVPGYDQF